MEMTLTEKEEYELRIKNMQSKIDYLREQRENLTTYAKKYEPLTDEQIIRIARVTCIGISPHEDTVNLVRAIEAVHGIKE